MVDPHKTFELMGYCDGVGQGRWISKYTYEGLLSAFPAAAAPTGPLSTTATGDFVLVRGVVDPLANQATLQPAALASGEIDVPAAGSYRAQLLGAAGNELAGVDFEPVVMDADSANPGQLSPPPTGLVLVPVLKPASSVAKIVVRHNGVEIGSATASPNPPSAAIVAPSGGQTITTPTFTFDWTAADSDGGTIWSNVLYSADGGSSWNALAIDRTETSLEVDRSALTASSDSRLRVLVSDGVHTATATSPPFAVANNAPDVEIIGPASGQEFSGEQLVTLEGIAHDREAGELDDAIAWSSSLDGPLGSGSLSVPVSDLSDGTHVITASAADGAGGSATDTVTIEVGAFDLTVEKGGTGFGTVTGPGIACGSDCFRPAAAGAIVTLTAAAGHGSVFDSWTGCDSPSGATCTMTMNAAKTVTANFTATPTFTDVPPTNPFYEQIEHLFDLGITTGCNPPANDMFCPADSVPRQQMAAFLIRAKGLTSCFPATPSFVDVPTSNPFFGYIERLKEQGITTGCNPPANDRFCPGDFVPRQQMAAFLIRAKGLTQLFPATPSFTDVPASNPFFGYIERLKQQGITTGCNPPSNNMYCPLDNVPRQQMAAFLIRAFAP